MSLAPEDNVIRLISNVVREDLENNSSYKPGYFTYRASSVGGPCNRKIILDKYDPDNIGRSPMFVTNFIMQSGIELIPPEEFINQAHKGTMIHEAIQSRIEELDNVIGIETPVKIEFLTSIGKIELVGHVDIFVMDNGPVVCDIKTTKMAKWGNTYLPKEEHLLQLSVYQLALQARGYLWYISMDSVEEHIYDHDLASAREKIELFVIPKLSELATYEFEETIPPIPFKIKEQNGKFWLCGFCPYKNICFPS